MNTEGLTLYALGAPRIGNGGETPRALSAGKLSALLFYVALAPAPIPRERLAALFWPEHDVEQSRANLRLALHRLNRDAPGALEASRDTVRRHSDVRVDVHAFEHQAHSADAASQHMTLDAYHADFLDGVVVPDAPDVELWLSTERERLRAIAQRAAMTLAESSAGAEAEAFARRALALTPWDERAYRRLMTLRLQAGDETGARALLAECRDVLAHELGVAPNDETLRLIPDAVAPPPSFAAVPLPATPFVGRAAELAAITQHLDAGERLLTLRGPGGIGKTRLAIAATHALGARFADGAAFVSFVGVHAAEPHQANDLVLTTLANALGCVFKQAQTAPREQFLRYMAGRDQLLVLDNLEHLRHGAALIEALVTIAPRVRIVMTSRERLGVRGERVIDIDGLSCAPSAGTATRSDAHRLFVDVATRIAPGFDARDEAAVIDRICELLGGAPLAIELAAHWTRAMRCADIAERVTGRLDALEITHDAWPARHRSMRAVLEESWRALDDDARAAFRRASVFQDGFDFDAGLSVTGAHAPALLRLLDAAWLKRAADGRIHAHELMRQFGAEQLARDVVEHDAANDAHARHFADLARLGATHADRSGWARALLPERDNLRAAWAWTLARNADQADGMLDDLWRFCDAASLYQDAVLLAQSAVDASEVDATRVSRARRLRLLGEAHYQLGESRRASACGEQALSTLHTPIPTTTTAWRARLARELSKQTLLRVIKPRKPARYDAATHERCRVLRHLSHIYYFRGEPIQTAAIMLDHLNTAERGGLTSEMAYGYGTAAIAFGALGLHRPAQTYNDLCLRACEHADDPMLRARALEVLAVYALGVGNFSRARAALTRAAEIFKSIGGWRYYAECHELIGEIAFHTGDYATTLDFAGKHTPHNPDDPLALALSAFSHVICHLRMGNASARVIASDLLAIETLPVGALEAGDHVCVYAALARLRTLESGPVFDPHRARADLESAFAAMRATQSAPIYAIEAYGLCVDAALDLWANSGDAAKESAYGAVVTALSALEQIARTYPVTATRVQLARGQVAAMQGECAGARRRFADALKRARQLGLPWEGQRAQALADALPTPRKPQAGSFGVRTARDGF
jgi:predicted ATPase